jgi:hypothetical protein
MHVMGAVRLSLAVLGAYPPVSARNPSRRPCW